jgi:ferredoxin-type protein NapF
VITRGSGGFPEVHFAAGECTFCGKCAEVCKPRALDSGITPPWDLRAAITTACLALNRVICRTCGESCEAGAIRFRLAPGGVAQPVVDTTSCNGCGHCVAGCPVNAIVVRGRNPEETTA